MVDDDEPSSIEEAQALSAMSMEELQQDEELVEEEEEEDDDDDDDEEEEEEEEPKPQKREKRRKREKVKAKIQVVGEQPDKAAPLVGYFPSGFDPQDKDEAEPPTVRVFRHEKYPKRIQLVVSPNGFSKVDFVGTSYSGEAGTGQTCTYALGVLDKKTETLKILPIASNKILRMEARVAGLEFAENKPQGEITAEQKAGKIRELTERFGTKKSRNEMKKNDALKLQEDPKTKANLDRKIKEVAINKDALESATAPTARNVPPYDSSATTPEHAYPLDRIILSGEWNYLLDILELVQGGLEVAPDTYPSFIRNRYNKLWEIQDEEEQKQLACILSYITHLIKFKDQHSMDGVASAKHHKIPGILRMKFSSLFAASDSKRLPDEKCALLISYVLVLTLLVDQFETDPSDIAKDLRMSPVTLRVHFEHLGCKFKRTKTVLLATLPVPLQFPQLRRRRQR